MGDYNMKVDEEEPSTSKKESQEDNSGDNKFVDSHDDDTSNIYTPYTSYSGISILDMAGTGPKIPKMSFAKPDIKSHQKRKRVKSKRIAGRVEKKKGPFSRRQAGRKAPKRKPKTKGEKKDRDLSKSTIYTRLSSGSLTPGCEYCGHRCCRRFENELRRFYQIYQKKLRNNHNDNGYRKWNKKYNSIMITEGNQTGSCSKMLSPLCITTNASPTDAPMPTMILHSEISPEMIQEALRKLTMWKEDIPTSSILDYLIMNYPVNTDKEALVFELVEKLRVAVLLGMVCRTSEDTWALPHEYQKKRVSRNHVTLFWKMYADTLRPVTGKPIRKQQTQPGENKETATRDRILTIHDEDIL